MSNETFVKLEPETESETETAPKQPKPARQPVCAGIECAGKHRGRCKAKKSPWRKQPKAAASEGE
jgi:hypothetical protein